MILDKDKKQEDYEGIKLDNAEKYSDISTIQSVLAGVGWKSNRIISQPWCTWCRCIF